MKWHEIMIKTTKEACDAVSEMLISAGSGGVIVEDPDETKKEALKAVHLDYIDDKLLQEKGDEITVKAYFEGSLNPRDLLLIIEKNMKKISLFLDTGKGFVSCTEVEDEDWANTWKKYYKPFYLCENIVIKPTWEQYENKNDELVIEIDPGMAFGTGIHETTRMSAYFLKEYMKPGAKVVDVGCGTGILSIVASKLGASHVTAVDIDSSAVKAAKENLRINRIESGVEVYKGELEILEPGIFKADIIVANIIADVVIDLSKIVGRYLKPEGFFIVSGIISSRKDEVMEAFFNTGFVLDNLKTLGEWMAIVFKCRDFSLTKKT